MADTSFLAWPFLDDAHRALARRAAAWWEAEGRTMPDGEGTPAAPGDAWRDCREIVRRLGEAGWLRHAVPHAGGALDVRTLCLLRETWARGSALADFAFALQGLGSGPLSLFGTAEQRAAYLPRVAAGTAIPAFALSEAAAGSDVAAMRATARRDGGDYVLEGEKTWISNAGIADFYVVFCRLPEGGEKSYAAFVVEAANPGLRVAERLAVSAPHPLGTVVLDRCRVPAGALVGEPGRGLRVALATLDVFRPTVGAAALGLARRALDEAVAQARDRRAFGQPLAGHQLTQAKLADMATAIDASALLVYRAAWASDRAMAAAGAVAGPGAARRVTREAAMAKLFATEAAQRVIDDAVQLLGARGVVAGSPVERLYREVRALRIYEGTSEIQRLVIAAQVLAAAASPPAPSAPSAHTDRFCAEALPPRELWPEMRYDTLPELAYPPRVNCAVELLDRRVAAGDGERAAIHYPGGRWTYRQLLAAVNRIGHALVEDLGVEPGNRVLLRGPNTPMLAACWLAVLKVGAVAVTTMPLLRVRELTYIAGKARIALALTDTRVAADCEQAMALAAEAEPACAARVVHFQADGGGLAVVEDAGREDNPRSARDRPPAGLTGPAGPATAGAANSASAAPAAGTASAAAAAGTAAPAGASPRPSLEDLARHKPAGLTPCDTAADDVAMIAFTSGTTGQGKGTMHFHRDVLAASDCFPGHVLRARPDDVFCGSPPLAFTYGLGGLLLFPLRIGASTLLLEQAAPANLLQGIQDHRATVCFTAPTAYRAMCGLLGGYDVASLRLCVSAGETLPLPTFEAWHRATGLRIIDGIGSTEMLHMFISSSGDEIRPGATGRVVPGYEARVVDDAGRPVPPGTIGRLAVRGPTGCRYLDNLERQRAYVQDGWNFTGDSYIQDPDGYFWYQARTDDMIISAGHNISGVEVEAVLLEHPKVRECGVVGTPDAERGMLVTAFVVLAPGAEPGPETVKELQDFVKAEIAPYKYPRRVEFLDALPRTETGKLQRFRLREGRP